MLHKSSLLAPRALMAIESEVGSAQVIPQRSLIKLAKACKLNSPPNLRMLRVFYFAKQGLIFPPTGRLFFCKYRAVKRVVIYCVCLSTRKQWERGANRARERHYPFPTNAWVVLLTIGMLGKRENACDDSENRFGRNELHFKLLHRQSYWRETVDVRRLTNLTVNFNML